MVVSHNGSYHIAKASSQLSTCLKVEAVGNWSEWCRRKYRCRILKLLILWIKSRSRRCEVWNRASKGKDMHGWAGTDVSDNGSAGYELRWTRGHDRLHAWLRRVLRLMPLVNKCQYLRPNFNRLSRNDTRNAKDSGTIVKFRKLMQMVYGREIWRRDFGIPYSPFWMVTASY
jgi:hypothetical protein